MTFEGQQWSGCGAQVKLLCPSADPNGSRKRIYALSMVLLSSFCEGRFSLSSTSHSGGHRNVGQPEGMVPLRRPSRRLEDNIKIDL
jgi:hypothetical protein